MWVIKVEFMYLIDPKYHPYKRSKADWFSANQSEAKRFKTKEAARKYMNGKGLEHYRVVKIVKAS